VQAVGLATPQRGVRRRKVTSRASQRLTATRSALPAARGHERCGVGSTARRARPEAAGSWVARGSRRKEEDDVNLLLFVFFGLGVAVLVRTVQEDRAPMSWPLMTGLSLAGAFAGGILSSAITRERVADLHTPGLMGSLVGASVVLLLATLVTRRRRLAR
jgi:uncharacterized membrane protein YeaQ/YmgE (transglycosylase-associated protein family)